MNKHLRDLIEVANFDKQIDDLGPKIDEVRKELDEKIRQKNQILKNIENLNQEHNSINLEIAHHDRNIQEISLKLDTIAKKQKDIKTEKELRALDIEEDIAKENMTHSNNEIQRLEAVKNTKEEEKAKLESQIQSLQAEIDVLENQTQSKVQEIKAIQQNLFNQKEALVAQMDNKITSFYAKIRRWALNTSVVPVFKQACGGCFIRLNDTIYAEILRGNDIINCPHCGRILYAPTDKPKVPSKTKAEA